MAVVTLCTHTTGGGGVVFSCLGYVLVVVCLFWFFVYYITRDLAVFVFIFFAVFASCVLHRVFCVLCVFVIEFYSRCFGACLRSMYII